MKAWAGGMPCPLQQHAPLSKLGSAQGQVLKRARCAQVMILSQDRERGRISLSTKKLEPTPGDMLKDPALVYEKADEMAATFRCGGPPPSPP